MPSVRGDRPVERSATTGAMSRQVRIFGTISRAETKNCRAPETRCPELPQKVYLKTYRPTSCAGAGSRRALSEQRHQHRPELDLVGQNADGFGSGKFREWQSDSILTDVFRSRLVMLAASPLMTTWGRGCSRSGWSSQVLCPTILAEERKTWLRTSVRKNFPVGMQGNSFDLRPV